MFASKALRRWILGLSCSLLPLVGCAQGPAPNGKSWFPWFRSTPVSELERKRYERLEASDRLKDPANLHVKYAQWREQLGDLTDARKAYQFALNENPKSIEAKLGLARLDQLSGRPAEAERGFQNVLKARPGDPQALNALGQFYASQENWTKALPLLEEAADATPGELAYRHHFALALAESGDVEAAFAQFRQAVGEAEAHYNIGFLMLEKGHKELARRRFQQAIALNPKLNQAQALLDELDEETGNAAVAAAPKPAAFPPVRPPVQQVASERPLPPLVESVRTVPTELPAPEPTVPPTWAPARQAGHTTTAPAQAPLRNTTPPVPHQATVPQAPVQQTAVTEPPRTEAPSFRPTWKKHQEPEETLEQTPEYLPPYRPEAGNPASEGISTQTPDITPAQREQWENQMKAAAGQNQ